MKPFRKSITKIKYTSEIDGKKKRGKLRAFLPPINQLTSFAKNFFSQMELDEILYLMKMFKFSKVFPVEKNEYVDYQEMVRCGLISKDTSASPLSSNNTKTLFYNAVKGSILQINMSEQGYYSFRDMVLNEFDEVDSDLDDMYMKIYKEKISSLGLNKKVRIFFAREKFKKLKKDLKQETWLMIISTANAHSDEIAKRNFPKRALMLLENFDHQEYETLIHDVIDELNLRSASVYKEIIMYLSDENIPVENILGWIIDNTCSTEAAFENIKREANYISQEVYNHIVYIFIRYIGRT